MSHDVIVRDLLKAAIEVGKAEAGVAGKQAAFTTAYKAAVDAGIDDKQCSKLAQTGYIAGRLKLTPERVDWLAERENADARPEGWKEAAANARQRVKRAREALGIQAEHSEERSEAARGHREADPMQALETAKKRVEKTLPTDDTPFPVRRAQAQAHVDAIMQLMQSHLPAAKAKELHEALEMVSAILGD